MPDEAAARKIAQRLYSRIREAHDWGRRFDPVPGDDALDALGKLAPREMRRALMTAFGNAKLDGRGHIEPRDLPDSGPKRAPIGFMQ